MEISPDCLGLVFIFLVQLKSVMVLLELVLDTVFPDKKLNIFSVEIPYSPNSQCPLECERLALNGECRREIAALMKFAFEG